MGDNTTYKINDDGSVTVSEQMPEYERHIIEILRIEKSKGGAFAPRRMKKRALKYARSANIPEFKVEKLMLDNYPKDFALYGKTTWLIVWACVAVLFFLGAVVFAFPTYFAYDDTSWRKEEINAIEEYQRLGRNVEYYNIEQSMGVYETGHIPSERLDDRLRELKSSRDYYQKEMIWWLLALVACLGVSCFSIRQYRRISSTIKSGQA